MKGEVIMNPTERIIRTFEGKSVDKVPTFCAGIEDRTFNEVLGKPPISNQMLMVNPVAEFIFDRWGPQLNRYIFQPNITITMDKRIKAAYELGFDSTWGIYDETFTVTDSKTMARFSGSIFNLEPDGYGNMTYMYRCPGITSREEFENWPYWPDTDEVAHRTYLFYRKMMAKYGQKMCIMGQGAAYGIQESLQWAIGFERVPLWIRREKDLIERYIAMCEELCMKTAIALLDAGVKIILQTDDFAFKSGPFMRPKQIDELFGPSYRRIINAVHACGGKFVLHSCGDNTLLFDTFISWGVDGLHAYEPTSNVDIYNEKKLHGDMVTIIGGVGIDYTLTDRSRDEEVVSEVKKLIRDLGPGGRFIIAPAHSMSSIPAHKLRVMLDTANRYGAYPIDVA
jgi:hypothetical protein